MFNTLKYAKILQDVGFTREQSEATVVMLSEVMDEKFATKEDLFRLQVATREDFVRLEASTKEDFLKLQQELKLLESSLIIKMGAMQAASIAIIVALIKIL